MTNIPDQTVSQDDGFGLLDMLAVLIEGWLPLVLVPTCMAALVYGVAMLAPVAVTYQANAAIAMAPETAAIVLSPQNLANIAFTSDDELPFAAISVTPSGSNVFTLSVSLPHRQAAIDALGAILTALTNDQFHDEGRVSVERSIQAKNRRIENLRATTDSLKIALANIAATPKPDTDARMLQIADTIDVLSETALQAERSLADDQQQLALWQAPKIVREPAILEHRALPSTRVLVTFAILISGFGVAVVLFLRDFWQRANANPHNSRKIARIRNALHLRWRLPLPEDSERR